MSYLSDGQAKLFYFIILPFLSVSAYLNQVLLKAYFFSIFIIAILLIFFD